MHECGKQCENGKGRPSCRSRPFEKRFYEQLMWVRAAGCSRSNGPIRVQFGTGERLVQSENDCDGNGKEMTILPVRGFGELAKD